MGPACRSQQPWRARRSAAQGTTSNRPDLGLDLTLTGSLGQELLRLGLRNGAPAPGDWPRAVGWSTTAVLID